MDGLQIFVKIIYYGLWIGGVLTIIYFTYRIVDSVPPLKDFFKGLGEATLEGMEDPPQKEPQKDFSKWQYILMIILVLPLLVFIGVIAWYNPP